MNNWILKLDEFGKIKKADIEISPFTLFVGDNNSGKSYIMSLIYGIMQLDFGINQYKINHTSKAYKEIVKWLKHIQTENGEKKVHIEKDIYMHFTDLLNIILNDNKKIFIRSIFNADIKINKIELKFEYDNLLYIKKDIVKDISEEKTNYSITFWGEDNNEVMRGGIRLPGTFFEFYDIIIFAILQQVIRLNCFEKSNLKSYYLPTSRTGFVLTYKTLVEKSLDDKFNVGKTTKNLLTRPCSEFLSQLSSISKKNINKKYSDVVDFIENNIIDGTIKVDEAPISDFMYIPNGSKDEIPMFVSSGVITEMTPLVLMLKYKEEMGALMMEEPEMCLHPKLQWLIARGLVQITNTGTPVIITTHSDDILQHINNMIKLSNNNENKKLMGKYKYRDEDLITEDKIKMYQFDVESHQTTIQQLKCGEFGFEAPTFNNMLVSLLEESRAFEEE